MAKTFLHYNKYETAEAVFRRIGQLTPEILLEVANEKICERIIYRHLFTIDSLFPLLNSGVEAGIVMPDSY